MTEDWRALLFRRRYLGVRLDLEPTKRVIDAWLPGVREHPPFELIQVVGTNGKGSTAAMIEHGLRTLAPEMGPVGLFTSPHLERIGERIRVDGVAIDEDQVCRGVDALARIEAELGFELSFFEVLTVIAVQHFVERGCRWVILEAGLGARLDSTTAMPAGRVAIARIALDHQGYLGDSLTAIAGEKAAAIRSSAPVFSVEQAPVVRELFAEVAARHAAALSFVRPTLRAPHGLPGGHQRHNAALALAVLRDAGIQAEIDDLDAVCWPGRLERVAIPTSAGQAGQLWLDVAHNLDGIQALAAAVDQLELRPDAIIFGAMADKAGEAMAARLAPLAPLWLVPPAKEGAFAFESPIEGVVHRFTDPGDPELMQTLSRALEKGACILACGSHLLVGQLRAALLGHEGDDPSLRDPVRRAPATPRN